jgi:hypothetical protein
MTAVSEPRRREDAPDHGAPERRRGLADRAFAVGAFALFVALWIGFAVVALGDPRAFDPVWDWLRGLPTAISIVVWVVFLPLTVGLWIWESTWPPLVGLLLAAGMVAWTLIAVAGLWRAVRPS